MKRGFTLIETLIVIGISVVSLIALVNLFLTFNSIYGYEQAFVATAGSASSAMNAFEAAVLPASQVLVSHDFSGTTYSSGATTLVLSIPSVDGSGNVIAGTEDYVVFYLSAASLYRRTLPGAGSVRTAGIKTLSTTLHTLSFTYDNADFTKVTSVIIDIVTQANYKQQLVQSHLNEKMFLRNRQPLP
ncbi:MAG: type II secretion system protein [Minisyncoccia bacterium]